MPTLMLPTLAMLPSNSHPQLSSQDLLARWVPGTCAATPYGIPGLKLLNSQAHGRCPGVVSRDPYTRHDAGMSSEQLQWHWQLQPLRQCHICLGLTGKAAHD